MKTFIHTMLFVLAIAAGIGIGFVATGKYYEAEFHLITNLDWNDFKDYGAKCEEIYGEPCGIYGGFAPKSQINIIE